MDTGAGDGDAAKAEADQRSDMELALDRENNRSDNASQLRDAAEAGDLEQCQKIIDSDAGVDLGAVDKDGMALLHWAAMNGKMDLAKLLLTNGAEINLLGGRLSRTSLQWAIRYSQFKMMCFLIDEGADLSIRDAEGCEAIHIAAQFGSIGILAYLLTKGVDPNLKDDNGNTPLMWACSRTGELDMIRLLLSFGVNMSIQSDSDKATALHRAIEAGNWYGVHALLEKGSPLNIKDSNGLTAKKILEQKIETKIIPHFIVRKLQWAIQEALKPDCLKMRTHQVGCMSVVKFLGPFLLFGLVSAALELEFPWEWKVGIMVALLLLTMIYTWNASAKQLVVMFAIPISLATKGVYYTVWFLRIAPETDPRFTICMLLVSAILWYNFLKGWLCDPGVVKPRLGERLKTISDLGKADAFTAQHFCSTCVIRRPMRSKHCAVCNWCVARFDHHCVYLANCVGKKNHVNFILYLICMVTNGVFFIVGCAFYWTHSYDPTQGKEQLLRIFFIQSPLTVVMFGMVIFHVSWIFWLLVTQMHQILWLGMTTNENLNQDRYGFLREGAKPGKNSVFNRGICQNLCDFLQISPCCPFTKRVNWYKVYWPLVDPDDPTARRVIYEPQAPEAYQPIGYPGYRPGSTGKLWPSVTYHARNQSIYYSPPFDSPTHTHDYV